MTSGILMRLNGVKMHFAFMVAINFLKLSCPCIYFHFFLAGGGAGARD